MLSPVIENIIVKYLNNQASRLELDQLENWISEESNEDIFRSYIKINYLIDSNMKKFNTELSREKLLEVIESDKKVVRTKFQRKLLKYAAAAAVLCLLSLTFVFKDRLFNDVNLIVDSPTIINNNIKPGSDKATLTLEDGSEIALEKGKNFSTQKVSSNGHQIVYNSTDSQKEPNNIIAYNKLTIPRGGEFFLALSDGTKVWLNSETQLKYPVNFIKGQPREVELVYGEAYFEVTPSTDFKGSTFKVLNTDQEVEVLGTKFNVKAYLDENNIYTTLAEGKIAVNTDFGSKVLSPNYQSVLNKSSHEINISPVKVRNEIAWINGEFILPHLNLKEIMQVLSRWYDMEVKFENKELEKERFVGIIRKNQNIEDILNNIKNLGILKDYEINNKKVILK